MKIKLYKLALFITALFIYGCTSSDDDIEMQSFQNENIQIEGVQEFRDVVLESLYPNGSLNKINGDEKNKPFRTFEYSNYYDAENEINIAGAWRLPGTSLLIRWHYPQEGDRMTVNGDIGHINWNIREPIVYIVDLADGLVKYSNWCEDERSGFFKENLSGKVQFINVDKDGKWVYGDGNDGPYDVYRISPFEEDAYYYSHITTVLTDAQFNEPYYWPNEDDCNMATREVKYDAKIWFKGGVLSYMVELDGVKYSSK